MKKKFSYLILLTVIMFSCQKEISFQNPANVVSTTISDTILLRKYILLDTTLTAPNDTIFKYNFYYDNLQRCTQVLARMGTDTFLLKNYYNGVDTLISKRKLYSPNSTDSTIDFYTYSSAGKILTDSILEYTSTFGLTTFIFNYQSTTNQSGTVTNKSNGNIFEYNNFVSQRDNNNNLTLVKDSLFLLVGSIYNFRQTTKNTLTYDSKNNPFYKVLPKVLVQVSLEGSTTITFPPYDNIPQKNNIVTEIKITTPQYQGADNCNNTYQYIYNSNDYPITMKMNDALTGKYYKGIFVY